MAYEATLIIQTGLPISMTCADGAGIEKGAVLALSDPFTAAAHASANQMCAGICNVEKIASDGMTKVSVFRDGIYKVIASGAITVGSPCALSSVANKIKQADSASCSGSQAIGLALETAADGESFLMELRPGAY